VVRLAARQGRRSLARQGTAGDPQSRILPIDRMATDPNVLTLRCAHCGHEHADEYECLEGGRPAVLVCESRACRQQFSFLMRECLECGEESIFTWKSMPLPETLALLSCNRCGAPFDETAGEGQKPGPAQRI
jgi:hypothetical protein